MRILITGGLGKIGSCLARELEGRHEIVLLDMRESQDSPHRVIQGDLMDEQVCYEAVQGVDAVAHLAALLGPRFEQAYTRNTTSTWNIAEAAAHAGVKRFAFASSINVFGQGRYKIGEKVRIPPYLPIDENVRVYPEDAYGLSKLAGEEMLRGFSDVYGMKAYCFRIPGVWMPDRLASFVPRPIEQVHPLSVQQVIDPYNYLEVRDVARAFVMALECDNAPDYAVSYITANDTTRPEPTAELIARFIPEWAHLQPEKLAGHTPWFSSERARRDLGWRPLYHWNRETLAPGAAQKLEA